MDINIDVKALLEWFGKWPKNFPSHSRGAIVVIPVYLVAMMVVMPIIQGFFFDSPPKAMVALMGHVVFGLAMGAIIGKPDNR